MPRINHLPPKFANCSKRLQTKTSTNQNVDKPNHRQSEISTLQNFDRLNRWCTETSTDKTSFLCVHRNTNILCIIRGIYWICQKPYPWHNSLDDLYTMCDLGNYLIHFERWCQKFRTTIKRNCIDIWYGWVLSDSEHQRYVIIEMKDAKYIGELTALSRHRYKWCKTYWQYIWQSLTVTGIWKRCLERNGQRLTELTTTLGTHLCVIKYDLHIAFEIVYFLIKIEEDS